MGRTTSLTMDAVAEVMRELVAVGRYPSMAAVRGRLGTGSAGTLLRLMREAREAGQVEADLSTAPVVQPGASLALVAPPADLVEAMEAVRRAYTRALAEIEREAEAQVASVQRQAREEVNQAHALTRAARDDLAATEAELEQVSLRLDEAETEAWKAQHEAQRSAVEVAGLRQVLATMRLVPTQDAAPPPSATSNG